ncbi:MAG TPA: hypothetical protein PLX50_02680 [Candidatus Aminicenantes bacterium]|nr:hypothetical protein [Candidatus Aminicenantes bacterium]
MKKKTVVTAFVLCLAVLATAAIAQEVKPPMRKEMVKLKYLKAEDVVRLLQAYQSPHGKLAWSSSLITISDSPEFVEKMLAVLKEIDVKPVDLVFTVQLILGSESAEDKPDAALQNDPLITELKKLLRYRTYTLLDTNLARTQDQGWTEIMMGKGAEFNLRLHPRYVREDKAEMIQLEVRMSRIAPPPPVETSTGSDRKSAGQPTSMTLIATQLTMKSGDKTVVGVSKLDGGDKGLILIISGKAVN